MSKTTHTEWFSSPVTFNSGGFEEIRQNEGVIKGVLMVSEGEARGHDVWLNKRFIEDTVKLGKASGNGVKARFGHPNMCNESLGTYLGTYRNVRLRKESIKKDPRYGKTRYHAVGDLHLSDVAKESPNGDLYNYILSLASDAPDKFGSSIVFSGDDYEGEISDKDGKRKKTRMQRIESLKATDLVDEPAATDGLFDDGSFASKATQFLNDNPKIYEICAQHPEIVSKFLNKYKETMGKLNFFGKDKKGFSHVKTKDGKTLLFEGKEISEGVEIVDLEQSEDLAGTYELEDGRTIEIDNKNTVVSLEEAEGTSTDETANAIIEAFDERFEKYNERLNKIEQRFEKLEKGSKAKPEKSEGVKNEVDQFDNDELLSTIQKKLNDKKQLSNGESNKV